jgi:Protein of unknown function (DUF4054)
MSSPCSFAGGVAFWNQGIFLARYPVFTVACNANPSLFANYFVEAGLYLSNCPTSPIQDVTRRLVLLNMLVAHISFLNGDLSADGQVRPVGRVSAAGEGSVNAAFEYTGGTPGTGAWFKQTQYGAAFWQATTALRSMHYIPGRSRIR